MIFNDYNYKSIKNIDIEEVSIRVINIYFKQDLEQVYLAIVIVKGKNLFFTIL
jgi:hypothetical protein